MIGEKEKKTRIGEKEDAEELKEVLGIVSKEVPGLIKGIISAVFSEEAGTDMGKAAAAFYKQLKEAGMPEDSAVEMTENYMSAFTNLSNIMNKAVGGGRGIRGEEVGEEISRKIKEKLAQRRGEEREEEEDED
jgi:hypothetical protein